MTKINYSPSFFKQLKKPLIILIDSNVFKSFPLLLKNFEKQPLPIKFIILKGGEKIKTISELKRVTAILNVWECHKKTQLIAIGGGATLDFVGFVASLWMRGIDWIAVPTTLLSQADSCYGGKTAINFANRKNLLGSIHPPCMIHIDSKFLKSLSEQMRIEGLSEIAKHALLVKDPALLKKIIATIQKKPCSIPRSLIQESLLIKKRFVDTDMHEKKGKRIFLNFGHSFAHSLEQLYPTRFSHGKALWWGLKAEYLLSQKQSPDLAIVEFFDTFLVRLQNYKNDRGLILSNLPTILKQFRKDKKNSSSKQSSWIALPHMGNPKICHQLPTHAIEVLSKYL